MNIAIAGYSGLIGSALCNYFDEKSIVKITREDLYGEIENLQSKIRNVDIVINLAGAPISKRWSKKNKEIILKSRILSIRNIVNAINLLNSDEKPKVLFNASAIGIYDDKNTHNEFSLMYDDGFMATVVKKWEDEAIKVKGCKLVILRFGIVLSSQGGALIPLKRIFNLGVGGPIASGKQIYSYIHIKDVCSSINYIISHELEGVFNLVTPNPVTNEEFSRTIANVLNRYNKIRVPEFVLKLVLGEASSIITRGQKAYPERLLDSGYKFNFVSIDVALKDILSKK